MPDSTTFPITIGMVIGVTGHRDLRAGELPRLREQVRAFFQELQRKIPNTPITLLSPLAAGADQLVTAVALEMGLRVIAALPVPAMMYRDDFKDNRHDLAEFDRQLASSEVLELTQVSGNGILLNEHPAHVRNLQYAQVGTFTASHCHILLALWDGSENGGFGGTAQIVEYHLHGTLPGTDDRQQAIAANLGLDQESLVYHIPTGRQSNDVDCAGTGRWLTSGDDGQSTAQIPESFVILFRRQAEYQHDCQQYRNQIQKTVSFVESSCPIGIHFATADWLAATYQRRVSRILLATYVLAALMGYTFILYSDLIAKDVVIYLFLLFFLCGVLVNAIAKRREWHRQYIDYRALAEGLRVQSYWRRAGIVDIERPAFVHDNFLQKQDVELGWIRNAMRAASLEGLLKPIDSTRDGIDSVIREWIGTADSPGQLAYYSATSEKKARHHQRNERLAAFCLWVGIGISVVLAVFARSMAGTLQNLMVVTMGVLSVTAAVHEAYAYKKADKELIKQYRFMARIFKAAKRRLDGSGTDTDRRRILRALGEAALAEHAEWTLMHRERPLDNSKI